MIVENYDLENATLETMEENNAPVIMLCVPKFAGGIKRASLEYINKAIDSNTNAPTPNRLNVWLAFKEKFEELEDGRL